MTSWYDAILALCKRINTEDEGTILDIVVDNGILGTFEANKLAKQLGINWKLEDWPLQEVAETTAREAVDQLYREDVMGAP